MYLPRAFAEPDLAQLDALFAADPFITLMTTDATGAPFVSHLPVLYLCDITVNSVLPGYTRT